MPAVTLPDSVIKRIRDMFASGMSKMAISVQLKVDRNTLAKYLTGLKQGDPLPGFKLKTFKGGMPPAFRQPFPHFHITNPGSWLIISDTHVPFHDEQTIQLAVELGRKEKVTGVLLNGDILDASEIATFDKDPETPKFVEEARTADNFLLWIRKQFPKRTRFIYKEGNHEERLRRYLIKKAPALFGLPMMNFRELLGLDDKRIEWVGDKNIIKMGYLSVVHGHEFPNGISAPVNPSRGFFLKSKESVLGGHYHQSSEHHEQSLSGRPIGAWSTGCCCGLTPPYSRVNKWNHGFAVVNLEVNGEFSVRNLRVMNGRIV